MTSFAAGEFVAGFIAEAEEHLALASKRLMSLDEAARQGRADPRSVRDLFRALHTIKGLSSMVAVEPVAEIAHAMESLLRSAERTGSSLPVSAVDLLVEGVRAIEERVAALARDADVPAAPARLVEALSSVELAPGTSGAGLESAVSLDGELLARVGPAEREQLLQGVRQGRRVVRIEFAPSSASADRGTNITTVRERLGKLSEIVKVVPRSVPPDDDAPNGLVFSILVLTDVEPAALARAAEIDASAVAQISGGAELLPDHDVDPVEPGDDGAPGAQRRGVVRVDVARLDDALDKLSALVVSRFKLERAVVSLASRGVDVRELGTILAEHGRQLRDLRGAVMAARMVSVAELLERVPLLVRGLSRATGKPVRLKVNAGRAELDKAVAERVFPAVVHLVRNAVDHAIEPPHERIAAGKPEEGLIEVSCGERSSRYLELVVRDDGRGVDRAEVARKAEARLGGAREVIDSDAALLDVLTRPGFSTRDEATQTSGRGIGMDVVKRVTVDELGGELRMTTTPGRGTAFVLRIPLSITIVDAISFAVGGQPFVVPVSMVEEIVEIDPRKTVRPPSTDPSRMVEVVERRGEAMPLVSLARLFSLPVQSPAAGALQKALLVRRNAEPCAFAVDRVHTQQEVVVRPIEDPLVKVPGVSGSTDLGDGRPTLVLDLVALSAAVAGDGARRKNPAGGLP